VKAEHLGLAVSHELCFLKLQIKGTGGGRESNGRVCANRSAQGVLAEDPGEKKVVETVYC